MSQKVTYKRCGSKLVLDMGKRDGRNYLRYHGFNDCPNPAYLENCSMFAHYNRIVGGWIMEWKAQRPIKGPFETWAGFKVVTP